MSSTEIIRKFAIGDDVIPADYPVRSTITGFAERVDYPRIDAPGPLYSVHEGNEHCTGVYAESELRPWIDPNPDHTPSWHDMTWADVHRELTKAQAQLNAAARTTETDTDLPDGLTDALGVAQRYLRPSSSPVEPINPDDEYAFHGDGPAMKEDILNTTRTVLAILESGEHVEATPCCSRVTAEGDEYFVTIDDETPEHLVDVAAHAIVSAVLLQRERDEAMNRAVVALAMAADPGAFKAVTNERHAVTS